ncbi:MAG: dienelactone hydrolase family protein [Bacteroidota bacterium]
MENYIVLKVSDGTEMRAYVARPSSPGKHPGILVFQEAFGVNAHIRDVADRFAREGYVAIAPELFHRTGTGVEGDYKDFSGMQKHFNAIKEDLVDADVRASYAWLTGDPSVDITRTACVGFCMGGRIAFQTNTILPVKAAISFYGGGIADTLVGRIPQLHGAALMFWAGRDKRILPEHIHAIVEGFRSANKLYTNIEFSEAEHGFFNDARSTYHKESAEQAWPLLLHFLRTHCVN